MKRRRPVARPFTLCAVALLAGCSTQQAVTDTLLGNSPGVQTDMSVLDLRHTERLAEIAGVLAQQDVVFVGERHDRYADHLSELAVIQTLAGRWPDMAIGMEFFQRPFQSALDDYVAGRIDEAQMLERTQYFDRWRFDYRLYRPILRFARDRHIPLVALSLPSELTHKVGAQGLKALDTEDKAALPHDIDRSNASYRERIRSAFDQHPATPSHSFERFLEVQLLWDEGMAETAAEYLRAHPGRHMVILAGTGHAAWHSGIPNRLARRIPVKSTIVISRPEGQFELGDADFLLLAPSKELPPAGLMGIYLEKAEGGVRVLKALEHSAAAEAGVQDGDVITAVAGQPVHSAGEIKIQLIDRHPGDRVRVELLRGKESLSKDLVLGNG